MHFNKITIILSIFLVALFVSTSFVSAFLFNGTIFDIKGNRLTNATINVTVRSVTNFGIVGYNFTTSNASGWFNMSVDENSQWFYEPVITHRNESNLYNFTDFVGQILPAFPSFVFNNLGSPAFYLKEGGTINITAINSTGNRIGFNYQVKDTKLGYPIAQSFGPTGTVTEVNIVAPRDRNYSILIFPNQSMPVSFDWSNFTSQNSYTIVDNVAGSLSSYNTTTKTLHKLFNTTMSFPRITGYINFTTGAINGWNEFTVVPFIIEPGSIVHATLGTVPYNLSAFLNTTDFHNLTNGYYNITLPGSAEGADYLLFATARNGSKYYGGFANFTLSYGGNAVSINITMYGLLGIARNITLTDSGNFTNLAGKNITTAKQSFTLINSTNNTMSQTSAHIEATVDYSNYGSIEFTWMEDIDQNVNAIFYLPLLNTTGIKEMNIFASGGDYSPKKLASTVSQIITNNNNNANSSNISINSFNPGAIDTALQASSITMALYISNSTCDIPSPPSACIVGSSTSMDDFNPMGAIMGGGALSFRMGTGGILVHYINVDMLASGPPDALFDSSATNENSGNTFDNAVRFGSAGPTIYEYILVSIPYSETAGSGLDESSTVNASISLLYNDNWGVIWNTTANGTNVGRLSGNFSQYSTRAGEWSYLLNGTICHTNATSINITNPCFIDKTNNRVWIRLPHFSGTGPGVTGNIVAATATSSSSSSGSAGGPTKSTWTNTFAYDAIEFRERESLTKEYAVKERVRINITNELHYVGVISLTEIIAIINVSSSHPWQATLNIGESQKFEVTKDNYYDILVTLNNIENNKANITISPIYELIPQEASAEEESVEEELKEEEIATSPNIKNITFIWIAIIIVILIVIGIICYIYSQQKTSKK